MPNPIGDPDLANVLAAPVPVLGVPGVMRRFGPTALSAELHRPSRLPRGSRSRVDGPTGSGQPNPLQALAHLPLGRHGRLRRLLREGRGSRHAARPVRPRRTHGQRRSSARPSGHALAESHFPRDACSGGLRRAWASADPAALFHRAGTACVDRIHVGCAHRRRHGGRRLPRPCVARAGLRGSGLASYRRRHPVPSLTRVRSADHALGPRSPRAG